MKQCSEHANVKIMYLFLFSIILSSAYGDNNNYTASWSSLDQRPLPRWYDEAKIGILVHWGIYSVPSCCGAAQWFLANWQHGHEDVINYMKQNYPPGFTYEDFASKFKAEFFRPDDWATLFKKTGAEYIVLTSKSQDGFAMFPSKASSWNAANFGPHRDLVGELSRAVRNQGLKFGIYYSLIEMVNTTYNENSTNTKYKPHAYSSDKFMMEMKQLVRDYEPSVIWADGHTEANSSHYNSTELLTWLYTYSDVRDRVVVNDRWGLDTPCQHGDFYTCRNGPGNIYRVEFTERVQDHKWEATYSLDRMSSGYRRDMMLTDVISMKQLLNRIVVTVSCGGNVLINIGATKEGTIPVIFQNRLQDLGKWLKINGDAIYGSSPWRRQQDTINQNVWYTCTRSVYDGQRPTAIPDASESVIAIYAIILKWPRNDKLKLRDITADFRQSYTQVEMLGNQETKQYLRCVNVGADIVIQLPKKSKVRSNYAWTLKITSSRRGIF